MKRAMRRVLTTLVCCTAIAGCTYFSPASISDMIPGMSRDMEKLECWLTMEFRKVPSGIDPRDVKVKFRSFALEQEEAFDWDYIAAHDVIPKGDMQGNRDNPETQPDRDPPTKVPIKVNFPLKAKPRIEIPEGKLIEVDAELYWGGKLIDKEKKTIEHVYQRQAK